ncbi:glycosyltransferase [Nocardia iowensis]|uniref:Glycosyltransferase n=1 Tax=Nocardia iowensis TaxID=204891 RepID=A0ABX8RZA7_NOCIO|nr:glycosyltransferase [Nocardia iowensis]QXN94187.1 glycosyltransferase [Nocardia iowensis]
MTINIPSGLQWLSWVAGSEWPQGDEDALFRLAQYWQRAATDLQAIVPDVRNAANATLKYYDGNGAEEAVAQLKKLISGDDSIEKLAEQLVKLGNYAENGGTQIEYTKLQIITTLVILAIQIAWALASLWGALAIPAMQVTTQIAIRMIVSKLLQALIQAGAKIASLSFLKALGVNVAIQVALGFAQELGIQAYQAGQGHRRMTADGRMTSDIDWNRVGVATLAAGASAAVAFPLGLGVGKMLGPSATVRGALGKTAVAGTVAGIGGVAGGYAAVGLATNHWEFDPRMLSGALGGALAGGIHGVRGQQLSMRAAAGDVSAAKMLGIQPGVHPAQTGESSSVPGADHGGNGVAHGDPPPRGGAADESAGTGGNGRAGAQDGSAAPPPGAEVQARPTHDAAPEARPVADGGARQAPADNAVPVRAESADQAPVSRADAAPQRAADDGGHDVAPARAGDAGHDAAPVSRPGDPGHDVAAPRATDAAPVAPHAAGDGKAPASQAHAEPRPAQAEPRPAQAEPRPAQAEPRPVQPEARPESPRPAGTEGTGDRSTTARPESPRPGAGVEGGRAGAGAEGHRGADRAGAAPHAEARIPLEARAGEAVPKPIAAQTDGTTASPPRSSSRPELITVLPGPDSPRVITNDRPLSPIGARPDDPAGGPENAGRHGDSTPLPQLRIGEHTVDPVAVHSLPEQRAEQLRQLGNSVPELYELRPSDADVFHEQMMKLKENNKFAASVHVYEVGEYQGMRMLVSDDGTAGIAIKGDEIVSVYSHRDVTNYPKAAHALVETAVMLGGRRLDCFDTVLPKLYAECGFEPVARLAWDDRYAPDGWSYETFGRYNDGRPDVVFMAHNPDKLGSTYEPGAGRHVDTYDEGVDAARAHLTQDLPAQADSERPHNRCIVQSIDAANEFFGRRVVGDVDDAAVGPRGVHIDDVEAAVGERFVPHPDHDAIAARLLAMDEPKAAALVIDEYRGDRPGQRYGAHAYLLTKEGNDIRVVDPGAELFHGHPPRLPRELHGTWAVFLNKDGPVATHEAFVGDRPESPIGRDVADPAVPRVGEEDPARQVDTSDARLRILLVYGDWGIDPGGVPAVNRYLAEGLAEAGHEVFVRIGEPVPENESTNVTLIPPRSYDPSVEKHHQLISHPEDLPPNVDAVIGHSRFSGYAAREIRDAFYPDAKLVHVVHMVTDALGRVQNRAQWPARLWMETDLVSTSDIGVGVGPKLAEEVQRLAGRTGSDPVVHELMPGIPFAEQLPHTESDGPRKVLFLGRNDVQKGAKEAAEMILELNRQGIETELIVRGVDPREMAQTKQILSDIAQREVEIKPFSTDRSELLADIRNADVMIMNSRAEGFGLVAIEAAGAGTPVLVSSESGAGKFFGDSSRFPAEIAERILVEQGFEDPIPVDRWVEKLRTVLADPAEARALARELQELMRSQNLTWKDAAERLAAIIRETHILPAERPLPDYRPLPDQVQPTHPTRGPELEPNLPTAVDWFIQRSTQPHVHELAAAISRAGLTREQALEVWSAYAEAGPTEADKQAFVARFLAARKDPGDSDGHH